MYVSSGGLEQVRFFKHRVCRYNVCFLVHFCCLNRGSMLLKTLLAFSSFVVGDGVVVGIVCGQVRQVSIANIL